MAKDFLEQNPAFAEVLERFDSAHGTCLRQIMLEGPEDALKETRHTQPAILFHSICALKTFEAASGVKADFLAGHSLGEFSALVAGGSLDWADALHLVYKRGEFMIKANSGQPFAMAAVIGLSPEQATAVCAEAEAAGLVRAVNFNTPVQTVISGTAAGVEAASLLAKERGAKRVLPLVVGGPFHTPMIQPASDWLCAEMRAIDFRDSALPVVSNVDALPAQAGSASRDKLALQIVSPVRWVDCVRYMLDQGVGRFIEFGPQKVLGGMIKNIDKEAQVYNLEKLDELEALIEILG